MWLLYYLAGINVVALLVFGVDKFCAVYQKKRISEVALLCLCALGGASGAAMGMILFHHKIAKPKFRYSVPLLFVFYQIATAMIIKEVLL